MHAKQLKTASGYGQKPELAKKHLVCNFPRGEEGNHFMIDPDRKKKSQWCTSK